VIEYLKNLISNKNIRIPLSKQKKEEKNILFQRKTNGSILKIILVN